jgi:hypothetical protein
MRKVVHFHQGLYRQKFVIVFVMPLIGRMSLIVDCHPLVGLGPLRHRLLDQVVKVFFIVAENKKAIQLKCLGLQKSANLLY